MRRALFAGEGRIEIATAALQATAVGEVRVAVGACCLCGSDLRPWRQGWPVTPGHEIAGRVTHPGHARDGEAVAVYIPVFCGTCPACVAGHTNVCSAMTDLIGWQRPGGYAEALNVPERCLLPLPDDIPMHLAPLLLDTIGTSAHGIRLAAKVATSGPALVVGAGPLGLGSIIVLKRFGFGPIAVVEPKPERREMAVALGAEVAPPDADDGKRYTIVLEASGRDAGRQMALERVAPLGAVVQLGESDRWSLQETRAVRRKDFYLIRSFYFAQHEWTQNLDLFRADRDAYARLVGPRVGLQGLAETFQSFARGDCIKPTLEFAV